MPGKQHAGGPLGHPSSQPVCPSYRSAITLSNVPKCARKTTMNAGESRLMACTGQTALRIRRWPPSLPQRRIRQRLQAVVAWRLRLVAPPRGQRSGLDHLRLELGIRCRSAAIPHRRPTRPGNQRRHPRGQFGRRQHDRSRATAPSRLDLPGSPGLAPSGGGLVSAFLQKDRRTRGHLRPVLLQDNLTVRTAATELRGSTATVDKLCELGELGRFRICRAIRIPREVLAAHGRRGEI